MCNFFACFSKKTTTINKIFDNTLERISAQKNGKHYSLQLLHFSKYELQNISISFFFTLNFVVQLTKKSIIRIVCSA